MATLFSIAAMAALFSITAMAALFSITQVKNRDIYSLEKNYKFVPRAYYG